MTFVASVYVCVFGKWRRGSLCGVKQRVVQCQAACDAVSAGSTVLALEHCAA